MDRTVVLITGCSSGIGLHLALRLASDPSRSFKVYATLRDLGTQGPLWEAARSRGCPPGSLETLQLDVRDADSVAAARARVTEGRVDVLVCNAGRGLLGPLEAHAAGAVESVLDVNVAGTVRTLQAFLPDMKRRGSGRILGCHSTLFTAPASSRSRVCARAWRFCSRPSGSSESPPTPLSPASGDSSPLSCGSHSGVSLAPPTAAHIWRVPGRLPLVIALLPCSWEAQARGGWVTGPRSPGEEARQAGVLMRISLTPTRLRERERGEAGVLFGQYAAP
ncbi:17-beta-hydroxysteroid dehydrogenase type 1 isoform X2 [Canis lupus baileyi]|uniref:17-beta-hydroxysteroid dehydrogenase type 1 isoform X2 n=1 Tax=Canis lupus baileyi TaxID=143281 RepID=UPI003B97BC2D